MGTFLNISNHPSDKWGEKQRKEALRVVQEWTPGFGGVPWGETVILDIPFPSISPTSAIFPDVQNFLNKYDKEIHEASAVHLMGESGFVYMLITALRQRGRTNIYHSTTERVSMEQDGKKTSTFRFIQFRKYSKYSGWFEDED